jgi:hypothetical protein
LGRGGVIAASERERALPGLGLSVSVSAAAASTCRTGGFWRETRAAAPPKPKISPFPSHGRARSLLASPLSPGFRCRDGPRRGMVLVVYGNKLL